MQKPVLASLFIFLLLFGMVPAFGQYPTGWIPPTNAYAHVKASNGTKTAKNYDGYLNFTGSGTISIYTTTDGLLFVDNGGSSATLDTMQNIGSGQAGVFAGNTSNTHFQFKTLKQGTGITITNNTNDITISNTGNGITSINTDTTAAQTLQGTSRNVTVTNTGATHTWNLGDLVVMTNGAAQTISKALTLASLILSGNANGGGFSFTNLNFLNATKIFQNGNQVIDTLTAGSGIGISGSGNSRTISNTGILSAITSINSQTGPSFTIQKGTSSNVKVTTTTNTASIDANNTAQIGNAGTHTSIVGNRINATQTDLLTINSVNNKTIITKNSTDVNFNSTAFNQISSSIVDLNVIGKYYDVVNNDTADTLITVTTEPSSPQFTQNISTLPTDTTYVQDYYVILTIGGKNTDVSSRTLNLQCTLNGVDCGVAAGTGSVTAGNFWASTGIYNNVKINIGDKIGVKMWTSLANTIDFRYASLYIIPYTFKFPTNAYLETISSNSAQASPIILNGTITGVTFTTISVSQQYSGNDEIHQTGYLSQIADKGQKLKAVSASTGGLSNMANPVTTSTSQLTGRLQPRFLEISSLG